MGHVRPSLQPVRRYPPATLITHSLYLYLSRSILYMFHTLCFTLTAVYVLQVLEQLRQLMPLLLPHDLALVLHSVARMQVGTMGGGGRGKSRTVRGRGRLQPSWRCFRQGCMHGWQGFG